MPYKLHCANARQSRGCICDVPSLKTTGLDKTISLICKVLVTATSQIARYKCNNLQEVEAEVLGMLDL